MSLKAPGLIKRNLRKKLETIKEVGLTLTFQNYLDKRTTLLLEDINVIEKGSYIRMVNQDKALTKSERRVLEGINKLTKNKKVYDDLDLSYEEYDEVLNAEILRLTSKEGAKK